MATRSVFVTVVVLALAAATVQHAQTPQSRPQFRAGVEYVEVDARVVDASGEPIRDLTQKDFQVFEDGVLQDVKTFAVIDIPLPAPPRPGQPVVSFGVKPDVATNMRSSARGRTYLIVFDALLVAPCQTLVVRKLLREFIERSVAPDDLVAIVSTGLDRSFLNFTNDKPRLLAVVNSLIGQMMPGPTVAAASDIAARSERATGVGRAGRPNPPIADMVMDEPRQAFRRLLQIVEAMSSAGEGSKAIILVTESIPFNMAVDPAMTLASQRISLTADIDRLSTAARRGNVPIYPVYPRGLTDGADCESDGGVFSSDSLLGEARQQQDNIRALADDAGGVPIVGTNNLSGGLERVVRLSSSYYVLGYNSANTKADGRYHRIRIAVTRADARVMSRKGYAAPRPADAKVVAALAGPPGSSTELRAALNAALPVSDIRISATAAAFRGSNGRGASTSVVLETLGSDLAWNENGGLTAPIEMTAVALAPRGAIRAGDHGRLQFTERTQTSDRVRTLGFRWLARLDDLTPGRYQIRGAISNGSSKQGSVWYDLEIPDFSKAPLAMSDVVLASTIASQRPTLRPDKVLAEVLQLPATSVRDFLAGDTLTLYAEVYDNVTAPHAVETTIVVTNDRGEEAFRDGATHGRDELAAAGGTLRLKARIPLAVFAPGTYTLAVEARQSANRAVSAGRAVPFQVASGGNR